MNEMTLIEAAVRRGALTRYRVDDLEEGELEQRMLWMRPEIQTLIANQLTSEQKATVSAALRRFIVGGRFTVVTAQCAHKEVQEVGDIRELKGSGPPFVELRFRPPPAHLRLFGRFIGRDCLFLTTSGIKSDNQEKTKTRQLSIPKERERCEDIFRACSFPEDWVPTRIEDSLSNADFF
jgi:hypothetical protein